MANENNTGVRVVKSKPKNTSLMGVMIRNNNSVKAMKHLMNNSLPNPDTILKELGKDIEEYNKVRIDPHVASCIQSRKAGVLSMKWEIQEGKSRPDIAKFIIDMFSKLDMQRINSEILEAPLYGFVCMEIYYKRIFDEFDKPKIIISDVVSKPQSRFTFDVNGNLRIKKEFGKLGDIAPKNKFLLVRNGHNFFANPYGDPILSRCYWSVHWKQNILDMYFNYLDKFGIPVYVLKEETAGLMNTDDSLSDDNVLDLLNNISQGGSVKIPYGYSLSKIESAGTMNTDMFKNMYGMNNAEISKAILSQTLTTELGDTGSYAASQTHLQVRKDVVDSDKLLNETGINYLIKTAVDINFGEQEYYPTFLLYNELDIDNELATQIQGFINTGKVKFEKSFMTKRLGWEENEFEFINPAPAFAEDETQKEITKPINPTTPKSGKKKPVSNSTIQDMLDKAIATALGGDGKAFNSAVAPIKNFLESKGSYENAISSIMDLYDDIDYGGAAKKIEQIQFVADCVGHLSITQHLD